MTTIEATPKNSLKSESFEDVTELRVYNLYSDLQNFKIRLKDASDPSAYNFEVDQSISFQVKGATSNSNVYMTGSIVQQLDFNDGSSSDDMNMPNSGGKYNDKNTITYQGKNGDVSTLVNFDTQTCSSVTDDDGIDGGSPVLLESSVNTDPATEIKYLAIVIKKQ